MMGKMDNSAPSLGFLHVSFIECDIQTRFEPIHVVSLPKSPHVARYARELNKTGDWLPAVQMPRRLHSE